MPVGLSTPGQLLKVPGIRLSAVEAGVRYQGRKDLVLMEVAEGGTTVGVFTRNAFCAAPVTVCKKHLAIETARYLLSNSGNANAGTGSQGMADALLSCELVAQATGSQSTAVLPYSTGVIGESLNMDVFKAAIPKAVQALSEDAWLEAAEGIITTDTLIKGLSRQWQVDGRTLTITGICKGSGMIRPDMATMLAYIGTDAAVESERLQQCLSEAMETSFNSITVDGDTSTNDSCTLMASGASGVEIGDAEYAEFSTIVRELCESMAESIIRDGEGATKFITVRVNGAKDRREARRVAYTVAHSPLVKTAFFASDPNWGRIVAAVGRARVKDLNIDAISVYLDDVCIVSNGGRDPSYREEAGQNVMNQDEITVRIELERGDVNARIWTTDLSHDYVSINADYRS